MRWVNAISEKVAVMLRHAGESDEAALARKLLLSALLARIKQVRGVPFPQLLREAREMVKATKHVQAKPAQRRVRTPEEIEREVREIYGWTPEELDARAESKN